MYVRVALTMGVILLSSRWVLLALGEEDFGIYSLVAGLLSMLSFLNLTLASSTQRFLSYALGKGDISVLNSVFNLSCVLHLTIGLIVLALFEIVGSIFLTHILQIPLGKEADAVFVMHCIAISMFISIIIVPYNASLITHENMLFIAFVQIGEALLKLLTAFVLLNYSGTRIRLYAICMMIIPLCSGILYIIYCRRNYAETRLNISSAFKKDLFKSFSSYTGWNLIGGVSHLFKTQGIAMLLNTFMGVVINAAYGIASQVNGQLQVFSSNMLTATRPQIIKSEGNGNRARMIQVSITTCRLMFILLAFLVAPVVSECDYILNIWLKEVPKYTVEFVQLFLIASLISQLYKGISIGIESVGSIKYLQIFVGGLHFLVLPVGYILLENEFGVLSVFYMLICEELLCLILTSIISKHVTGLNISMFTKGCVIPCAMSFVLTLTICLTCKLILPTGLPRLLLECVISVISSATLAYYLIFDSKEKALASSYIKRAFSLLSTK